MDDIIADIKRILEEDDPSITVSEALPPQNPEDGKIGESMAAQTDPPATE